MRIAISILIASAITWTPLVKAENFGAWFTGKTNDEYVDVLF